MQDLQPETRALLRQAAARAATRVTEEVPHVPDRAKWSALHALLADCASWFIRYGLEAWTPMENQQVFSFRDRATLTVHVKPELPNGEVRGLLRETPDGGGPVRAVPVEIAALAWDPALSRLVPADPTDQRPAVDRVLIGLLRALRLS